MLKPVKVFFEYSYTLGHVLSNIHITFNHEEKQSINSVQQLLCIINSLTIKQAKQ